MITFDDLISVSNKYATRTLHINKLVEKQRVLNLNMDSPSFHKMATSALLKDYSVIKFYLSLEIGSKYLDANEVKGKNVKGIIKEETIRLEKEGINNTTINCLKVIICVNAAINLLQTHPQNLEKLGGLEKVLKLRYLKTPRETSRAVSALLNRGESTAYRYDKDMIKIMSEFLWNEYKQLK